MFPAADFAALPHPFVWTTRAERAAVLNNVNDPLWSRFLAEAERHFADIGELRSPAFPVWCHDGDLDELMAVAVLAYVRDEPRFWSWIADWLRGLIAHHRASAERWHVNLARIMLGDLPASGNPRQFFEGFVRNGAYWVEGGFMTVVLHLLDLLEAHAPAVLSVSEKSALRAALVDFARRYAFHEEAVKYSNRGMWANAGILCSALAHENPGARRLLLHQAARRHDEFRSTFLDDGSHAEGAPDYHLMALDGLLAYALPASHLGGDAEAFAGRSGDEPFQAFPAWTEAVRAYLRTVHPGPTLMNHPRGCSVFTPISLRPALLQAYRLTRDSEIGWFIARRMAQEDTRYRSPLRVTPSALLGLGHYQPLLNFWLYRPIEKRRPPSRRLDILPDHGGLFSRSGWDDHASLLTARFGYEGTGKGHRDHGHVTVSVGGEVLLCDPFPRFGPAGLESSLFHNTVTMDRCEPAAVVGRLAANLARREADAFFVVNSGGVPPCRDYLHDPREESNSWFTNQAEPPAFDFSRALFHLHSRAVVGLDRVKRSDGRAESIFDWFFHTPLSVGEYSADAALREESYRLRPRNVTESARMLPVPLLGASRHAAAGRRIDVRLAGPRSGATLSIISLNTDMIIDFGRRHHPEARAAGHVVTPAETADFIRVRASASSARLAWLLSWGRFEDAASFTAASDGDRVRFSLGGAVAGSADFSTHVLDLSS